MKVIRAKSVPDLWVKTFTTISEEGDKLSGIQEIPNLALVLTDAFGVDKAFDAAFRKAFGNERIDYASSVTFVKPKKALNGYLYQQNEPGAKWTKTYWGRMIAFGGEVNQIENAIKRLSGGKNTKMLSIAVYDPKSDHKKTMGGIPCLTSLDLKPRNGKLDMTAFMRSMRFTKSGYADIRALCDLGTYICERSSLRMNNLTMIATSGHIFYSGDEYQNSLKLLKAIKK